MDEAKSLEDTLWDRLSQRDRRAIAWRIMMNRAEAAETAGREADGLRAIIGPLRESESAARDGEKSAKEDAMMWQLKANGRGGRGFLIGLPLGGLATYGGLRLFGVIR